MPLPSYYVLNVNRLHDESSYGAGKVFGSDEVNVEAWKPLKRLVGHQSGMSVAALGFENHVD
jgi:hypothetical protein